MRDDDQERGAGAQTKALMRGLTILRLLVDAPGPLTATEIARRCGLHQSSVSRILSTLAQEGYVRKETYHSFVPDYGVLALGVACQSRFDLIEKPRQPMADAADRCSGLTVSLCMLWRDQMLYFLRSNSGRRPVLFEGDGYPMHLSSPALLFVAGMDDEAAMHLLQQSRRRFGWDRPTENLPRDERDAISIARGLLGHDCMILTDWGEPDHVSAAINLRPHEGHRLAVALSGRRGTASNDKLQLLLHEIRRDVESVLDAD